MEEWQHCYAHRSSHLFSQGVHNCALLMRGIVEGGGVMVTCSGLCYVLVRVGLSEWYGALVL